RRSLSEGRTRRRLRAKALRWDAGATGGDAERFRSDGGGARARGVARIEWSIPTRRTRVPNGRYDERDAATRAEAARSQAQRERLDAAQEGEPPPAGLAVGEP